MNILREIQRRFETALTGLAENPAELVTQVRASQDPKFGDYQANCAMPLGKKLGKPPREIAAEIVQRLKIDDLCELPEIVGPGFINLRLRKEFIVEQAAAAATDPRLGVPTVETPKTYIVDYSAPNVAKPMHVGHIRSTVIGDCLYRTLKFLGHKTFGDNHLGDWGTQFGMIIYGYKNLSDEVRNEIRLIDKLSALYRLANRLVGYHENNDRISELAEYIADEESKVAKASNSKADKSLDKETRIDQGALVEARREKEEREQRRIADDRDPQFSRLIAQNPEIVNAVLRETVKLHQCDPENIALWKQFMTVCLEDINRIYARLGVKFDVTLGESFYHDRLAAVVNDLEKHGLAKESEGAIGVWSKRFGRPFLIRKSDGAFLYATTDLATILYRMEKWKPNSVLYVVDHRQSVHFEMLFETVGEWKPEYANVEFKHVSFGTVLGKDSKPFKTRSGDTVGLESLLDEGISRALAIVSANDDAKPNGPELSPEERKNIAEVVGIGALKYADLSQNRTSDYVFDYDKMLAMNGNTATYMQYAHARVRGIFLKGQEGGRRKAEGGEKKSALQPFTPSLLHISHPAERSLALTCLQLAEAIDLVLADYRPNQLTNYLFELANRFSTFYENCPVLRAETPELLESRLALCDLTAKVLREGLALLGIEVVERM